MAPATTPGDPPSSRRSAATPFRILALSGGGFLGFYTACVLAALEDRVGEPLARRFDLVAGTSVGGILALGLAFEVPMSAMVELFSAHGAQVFSDRSLPSGTVSRLLDLTRSVMGPKYTGEALRDAVQAQLDARRLGDALHDFVIPAVDVHTCRTKVFKTPHGAASEGDAHLWAVDVAMAASAAPGYFPSVRIGERLFADGGLFAVAPDQVALHEAEHFLGVDLARVRMLSVGTAVARYRPAGGVLQDAGAVNWLSDGRLVLTLLASQQQHVQAMVEDRLGTRYLRLDAEWPAGEGLGIDVATPHAIAVLAGLARRTVSECPRDALAPFLDGR